VKVGEKGRENVKEEVAHGRSRERVRTFCERLSVVFAAMRVQHLGVIFALNLCALRVDRLLEAIDGSGK